MTCLVYAILRASEIHRAPLPCGIAEGEVEILEAGGLAVAFSKENRETVAPENARLLAFARVIADLGHERTILPVRYGNLLEDEEHARRLLQHRHDALAAALDEVDGCAEMSLRVMHTHRSESQEKETEPETQARAEQRFASCSHASLACVSGLKSSERNADLQSTDGLAYLRGRRTEFDNQDNARRLDEGHIEHFRAAFEGLFVRFQVEEMRARHEALVGGIRCYPPLHFLVRRENLERFRRVFRRLEEIESVPMLLTGPWVPFNFVNLPADGFLS